MVAVISRIAATFLLCASTAAFGSVTIINMTGKLEQGPPGEYKRNVDIDATITQCVNSPCYRRKWAAGCYDDLYRRGREHRENGHAILSI